MVKNIQTTKTNTASHLSSPSCFHLEELNYQFATDSITQIIFNFGQDQRLKSSAANMCSQ